MAGGFEACGSCISRRFKSPQRAPSPKFTPPSPAFTTGPCLSCVILHQPHPRACLDTLLCCSGRAKTVERLERHQASPFHGPRKGPRIPLSGFISTRNTTDQTPAGASERPSSIDSQPRAACRRTVCTVLCTVGTYYLYPLPLRPASAFSIFNSSRPPPERRRRRCRLPTD